MTSKSNNARRGFTIVELVIIIAVLSILVAILVPTFNSVVEKSRQNALRMDLGNAYTSFKADCGFRDEVCLQPAAYIFVHENAIDRNGDSLSATKLIFVSNGYRWIGDPDAKVETVTSSQLTSLFNSKAVMYGPFNKYYLIGLNMANQWEGDGTAAKPYLIKSYRDLRSIGEHTARGEDFYGKHFLLTTDLSVTAATWLPIGGFLSPTQEAGLNNARPFSGTFDGGGHTIALNVGQTERSSFCLFGHTSYATIRNLKTTGSIDLVGFYAAGIVADAEWTTIYNCENAANVTGDYITGGIVAYAFDCNIYNCVNTGDILCYGSVGESYVGGIVGKMEKSTLADHKNDGVIENCRNEGDVFGYAGIVGGISGNIAGTIRNCVNAGNITARNSAYLPDAGTGENDVFAGGITGCGTGSAVNVIDGCLNTGAVTGSGRAVGGIIGANPKSVTNCANTGNITANGYVGGIVGVINNSSTTVANVMNSGVIASKGENGSGGPVGGIIGHLGFTNAWTLTLAVSGGEVQYRKGESVTAYNDLGMFVGSAGGKVTLNNAYLAISAGATIGTKTGITQNMGKSITVSGTPTTQTNQSTLRTTINSVISGSYSGKGYRSWSLKTGYLGGYAVPTHAYTVSFDINKDLPSDQQVGFLLNTNFIGASAMYLPTPSRKVVVSDGWQYTFKHWSVGGSNYAPGAKITLTGDTSVTAVWEKQPHTMAPIPFG